MNIEDEIYAELVKRFGIGEICLPKYRHNRPTDITWKDFILQSLVLEPTELYTFCGVSSSEAFSSIFRNKHKTILEDKNRRSWRLYLLSIVNKKQCPKCDRILFKKGAFAKDSSQADGLNTICKDCVRFYQEKEYWRIKEYNKNYYLENRSSILAKTKEYRLLNKESFKEYGYTYRILHKDDKKAYDKHYYQNNKYLFAAKLNKRRANKLQATPKWADLKAIKEIYKNCPEGFHVDHWAPLQGGLVCGLHCEFNLQYLTVTENLSKGNRFEI